MKYCNVHTGEIENWKLELGSHSVMVADSGARWSVSAIRETPAFDTCWQPVDEGDAQPDDGCGYGGAVP